MKADIADITIYTKNNCGACVATKSVFDNHKMPYTAININDNPDEAMRLYEAGFRAMPVVQVVYETGESDVWTGFKAERIYELTGKTGA